MNRLEYDFLGILNDYIMIYREFLLPAIICDTSFKVCWSNPAAKTLYPHLTNPQGLGILLGEFDSANLIERLKNEGTLSINSALAFSGVRINLVPIYDSEKIAGAVAILIGSQAVLSPQDVAESSKTPEILETGIRRSVEEIFRTMDDAALKADMLQAGWIKQSLNSIAQSGYHILRLAANLSQFTQYQAYPPQLVLKVTDVFEMLSEARGTITGLAAEMGISVRFNLPKKPGLAAVDADKLQLAVFNILHNSFYFTKPGNRVDITGKSAGNTVKIIIHDKGCGIAPDVLPQIYKPYFSKGHDGKPSGLGLGLPTAKAIIEAHGGEIEIESAENSGTTATVTLPSNTFSHKIEFAQGRSIDSSDRFSQIYVGLASAASSPYREK